MTTDAETENTLTIPAGYVLMPVEITMDMRRAFQTAFIRGDGRNPDQIGRVYDALVEFRPIPPGFERKPGDP